MDKVSIIIPTYNRAHLVLDAIDSATNQTHKNIEIIVIDDHSEDDTEKVLKNINNPKLKYYRNSSNLGVAGAVNRGIGLATGQYVFPLGDDDLIDETTIEKMLEQFRDSDLSNLAAVYCWVRYVNVQRKEISSSEFRSRGKILDSILCNPPLIVFLFKMDGFKKVGLYDESLLGREDHDMWIRFAANYSIDFVPEDLYHARIHGQNHLTSLARVENAHSHISIINKNYQYLIGKPKILGENLRTAGSLLCLSGHGKEGRAYLYRAIKSDPYNPRSHFCFLLSILGSQFYKWVYSLKSRLQKLNIYS